MSFLYAARVTATEVLCDTASESCRTRLLTLIDNEQVGIDVGFWVMEDSRIYTRLVSRKNAGVAVRVIMDSGSLENYPLNQAAFDAFRQAGIPMIEKSGGGIMHWKLMIFAGQNTIEFGSANFSQTFHDRKCACCLHVLSHVNVSLFFAGLGKKSRRLSSAFRLRWFSIERRGAAWRGHLYIGRFTYGSQMLGSGPKFKGR